MTKTRYPASAEEAAALIRDCAGSGTPVVPRGGGTRLDFAVSGTVLSTAGLAGIAVYNPAEMVMTAGAGTPLAEVEAALAANGQMLPFEPADSRPVLGTAGEPTIGGVFAANVSGPRRLTAGAARDSLLGVTFVNGRGEVIRAGGRVMKNVTGLDLVKLMAGSRGTLGYMTDVTFRVLPAPRATETVVVTGLDDAHAAAAMATAMSLPVEVSGAAHLPFTVAGRFLSGALPQGAATVFRLEGLPHSVSVRTEKLTAALSAFGVITWLDEPQSLTLWRQIRDAAPYAQDRGKVLWRVSVAPTAGHLLMGALRLHAGADCFYDWQGGLIWLRMEADPEADFLRKAIRQLGGGHATLVRAPDRFRKDIPAFEPEAPAVAALSARIREKFDPRGIFNPGLMG
ncbi:FAD-binding protein [Rhizobiaceae bacterium BDR2-2]|uniref:FAD-binding protein n=1 Tax=Ectorhizobium quercum TaxID=2965071 RepID=A0AAE3N3L8_9HYPH|nr:FAD-binding protein [Ectorhizobium quercum]MCX8996276.1 FAD-binding protein [Ectorhizobium quercum]MCX8998685.1 FAD-binding protein [Ectorhizobium quercum]